MKAAMMFQSGELPQYVDIPEPTVQQDDELLVQVKAVAIKHFDKGRATGKHYSSTATAASGRVIGGDGVCVLKNGTRVYGMGVFIVTGSLKYLTNWMMLQQRRCPMPLLAQ